MNDSIDFWLIPTGITPPFRLIPYWMGLGLANDLFFCYLFHIMAEITTGSLWRLRHQYLHRRAQDRNGQGINAFGGVDKTRKGGEVFRARPGETGTSARETGPLHKPQNA